MVAVSPVGACRAGVGAAPGAWADGWWKILFMMLPKMLIACSPL